MVIMKNLSKKTVALFAAVAMTFAGVLSASTAQAQEIPSAYTNQLNSAVDNFANNVQSQVENTIGQFDSQLSSGSSFLSSQPKPQPKIQPSPAPQGVTQHPQRAQNIINKTNAYRASHGLAPVRTSPELTNIAQNWADHLATTENLEHRPQHWNVYPSYIPAGGENVLQAWYDYSDDQVVKLFADSPGHNKIMLDPRAKSVGIGVSIAPSGKLFVVENYGR